MGSTPVVVISPLLEQHLCFTQRVKQLAVQEFIPELPIEALAIEALAVAVLPRTFGFHVPRLRAEPLKPSS